MPTSSWPCLLPVAAPRLVGFSAVDWLWIALLRGVLHGRGTQPVRRQSGGDQARTAAVVFAMGQVLHGITIAWLLFN